MSESYLALLGDCSFGCFTDETKAVRGLECTTSDEDIGSIPYILVNVIVLGQHSW